MSFSILPASTAHAFAARRDTVGLLQAEVDRASRELSTGQHDNVYRAIGSKAERAFDIGAELKRVEGFLMSNSLMETRLEAKRDALNEMRSAAEEFFVLLAPNQQGKSATAEQLQNMALVALDQISNMSNSTFSGQQLFSGVASDRPALAGWDEDFGAGSPAAELAAVVGAGLTDAADAASKADALDAIFGGARYGEVFFGGDTGPNAMAARIDADETLEYGVRADSPAFRDLIQGLSMMASTDVSQIEDAEAYQTWVSRATAKIAEGIEGVLAHEADLGIAQERLDNKLSSLSARRDLLTADTGTLLAVDSYDAATRLTELSARLEASYSVTARLAQLSFLNYL
jgi:flagellar hook-associated protein 3 FlgL